jgi:hypothetical protein
MTMLRGNKLGQMLLALVIILFVVIIGALIWQNIELRNRVDRAESAVGQLVLQNQGVPGPEGDPGRAPTTEEIAAAVAAYCGAHSGCVGPAGTDGQNGADGASIAGPAGPPGSGITSVRCNGTSISFFSGTQLVGNVSMVCIQ